MLKGEYRFGLLTAIGLHVWTVEELDAMNEHDFWVIYHSMKEMAQR
jgi:hypothetical protein